MTLQLLISSFLPLFVCFFFAPPASSFGSHFGTQQLHLLSRTCLLTRPLPSFLLSSSQLFYGVTIPGCGLVCRRDPISLLEVFPSALGAMGSPLAFPSPRSSFSMRSALFYLKPVVELCVVCSLDAELELRMLGSVHCALLDIAFSESLMHQGASFLFYFPVLGHHLLPTSHPATTWTSNLPTLLLAHLPLLLFFPPSVVGVSSSPPAPSFPRQPFLVGLALYLGPRRPGRVQKKKPTRQLPPLRPLRVGSSLVSPRSLRAL